MPVNQQDIQTIEELLAPALGEKTWGLKLSETGWYISLEIGDPTPVIGDPNRIVGKWHLFTYACAWRLEKDGSVLAGSMDVPTFVPSLEDDPDGSLLAEIKEQRSKIEQALQSLNGVTLQSIKVQRPAFDTILTFNDGVILYFFSMVFFGNEDGSVTWRHWSIYIPVGQILIIGPGTTWSVKKYSQKN
jgi:hypothetical protein